MSHPDYLPLPQPWPTGPGWVELGEDLDAFRRLTGACLAWTLSAVPSGDLDEVRRRFDLVLMVDVLTEPTDRELTAQARELGTWSNGTHSARLPVMRDLDQRDYYGRTYVQPRRKR